MSAVSLSFTCDPIRPIRSVWTLDGRALDPVKIRANAQRGYETSSIKAVFWGLKPHCLIEAITNHNQSTADEPTIYYI